MAQPIHCDAEGDAHLADVMVSELDGSSTLAWCHAHYVEVVQAIAQAVADREAEATAADAADRLAGVTAPADPPTSPGSSDADGPPAEPPTNGAGEPEPPTRATRTRNRGSARPGPSVGPLGDPGGGDPAE